MSQAQAIEALRQVVSGNVSDAMEQLGLPRRVLLRFTAFGHGKGGLAGPVVGPAFTLEQALKPPGAGRDAALVRHGEVTRGLAGAGDVIVIATGGITDVATWGENHSMRCRRLGVAGLVTDGATRDAALVDREGFPVFCRGVSPVKSRWDLATTSIGAAVTIDGVTIAPGDIIFADDSGILVIPAGDALAVAMAAREIRHQEEAYQEGLHR